MVGEQVQNENTRFGIVTQVGLLMQTALESHQPSPCQNGAALGPGL